MFSNNSNDNAELWLLNQTSRKFKRALKIPPTEVIVVGINRRVSENIQTELMEIMILVYHMRIFGDLISIILDWNQVLLVSLLTRMQYCHISERSRSLSRIRSRIHKSHNQNQTRRQNQKSQQLRRVLDSLIQCRKTSHK